VDDDLDKNKVEFKNFIFDIKEIKKDHDSNTTTIVAFSGIFNNIDLGRDRIQPGAFAKTIKENVHWLVLRNHDTRIRIGFNAEATEEKKGLRTHSRISLDIREGFEQVKLSELALEMGGKDAKSFGFATVKSKHDNDKDIRDLLEVKVFEDSFVAFGMNEKAFTTAVKFWNPHTKELGIDEHTDLFYKYMVELGHTYSDVKVALQTAAAGKSVDPNLIQSADDILNVLKQFK